MTVIACPALSADKEKRTLTISDNGIGMTRDEVIDNPTIANPAPKLSGITRLLTRPKTAS